MNTLRYLFLIFVIYTCAASAATRGPAAPRRIVAVLDVTPSFRSRAAAVSRIKTVVRSLAPGDTFLLLKLGGPFAPADSVRIQCTMPVVKPALLQPARTIPDYRDRQARIDAIWTDVARKQAAILRVLDGPWPTQDVTPLYALIDYLSHWVNTAPADGSTALLLFTDLENDAGGQRSTLPPTRLVAFGGASITVLFVPWGKNWAAREKAWGDWFVRSGASRFVMLDEARSQAVPAVDFNAAPRVAAKTF